MCVTNASAVRYVCGRLCGARGAGLRVGAKVLEKMAEEQVKPTVDTFNILMYGCAWAAGAGDGWLGELDECM
jgi:hypothetical protein